MTIIMNTYRANATLINTFLGCSLILIGSLTMACRAAQTEMLKPVKPFKIVNVEKTVVEPRNKLPKRYAIWDKKTGTCGQVYVEYAQQADGRLEQTKTTRAFRCGTALK